MCRRTLSISYFCLQTLQILRGLQFEVVIIDASDLKCLHHLFNLRFKAFGPLTIQVDFGQKASLDGELISGMHYSKTVPSSHSLP